MYTKDEEVNRRSFLKRLGVISTALAVCPSTGLERWQYLDFIPGETVSQGVIGPVCWGVLKKETANEWAKRLLNRWIESIVPERFRHGKKEYNYTTFDYGNKIGTSINYTIPFRGSKG